MSVSIQSVDLKNKSLISNRSTFIFDGRLVKSINVNQLSGDYIVTEPLKNEGQIVIFPQSPQTQSSLIKTYSTFSGYGSLSLPVDARFDFIRRKVWIADLGNSAVVKLNTNDYNYERSIGELTLPHSVIPEINGGGVFVKSFIDSNTGLISYYDSNNDLRGFVEFPDELKTGSLNPDFSFDFIQSLPLTSTMAYDHVRFKLWWTSKWYVYCMDIRNNQVTEKDLRPLYVDTRGLDIDFSSGNSFVVVQSNFGSWFLVQLFRDNRDLSCWSYLDFRGLK